MPRSRACGVTLVELVLTLVIVGIFAGGGALLLVQGIKLWSKVTFQADALSQADVALEQMQREIAQIKDDASLTTADSTTLAFTTIGNQNVQYQYTAGTSTLTRNGQLLAGGVQAAPFQYWNVKGQTLAAPQVTSPTDIWRIGITLTVASAQETATASSQVLPRNFLRANK